MREHSTERKSLASRLMEIVGQSLTIIEMAVLLRMLL